MRTWRRLIAALGADAGRLGLRTGATETSIVAAETLMNVRIPADYRAWLAIADGQEIESLSILPTGGWLVSLDRLLVKWTEDRPWYLDDDEPDTQADGRIRPFVFHPRRLTIGGSRFLDDDNTLIDLVPGAAGTEGQVINFVTECDFVVYRPSFDAYLDRVAELVESRALIVADTEDGLRLVPPGEPRRWDDLVVEKTRRPRRMKKR